MKRTVPIELLSKDEVKRLVDACGRMITGLRDAALIVLLYRSGLRIAEALSLYPKDINGAECMIRILHGKNNKARTSGIDPFAIRVIEDWIKIREERLGIDRDKPIFCTIRRHSKNDTISDSQVRNLMVKIRKKTEIAKRVHCHGFRHTHASELAGEGNHISVIQRQLGHSNPLITSQYIDSINPVQVIEAVRSRERPW